VNRACAATAWQLLLPTVLTGHQFQAESQMNYTFLINALVVVTLAGCNEGKPMASTPSSSDTTVTQRDNTGVNVRDRSDAAKTPIDQNENQKDIDVTANIRKRVVDTQMSINAQNVKIITQDGKVTLRGPVKSDDEKSQIEKLAHEVAGPENVDNQLEVQP
jgi:hyperosmotically inducible periplasmic protein